MEEESSSSRDSEEVLGAAQQLMQLSNELDDDSSSNNNVVKAENNKNKKMKKKGHGSGGGGGREEEVDQRRCQIETSIWSKIEEIFGKDDGEEGCDSYNNYYSTSRPKKRRFRSIQSIYMKTKPIVNARFYANGDTIGAVAMAEI